MTGHFLVIDCSAIAYRAYHALPAMYRQDNGEPTGAVLGFMSMMWNMLGAAQADQPTHAAAVFDAKGANFRHKLYPPYKGGRDPARAIELANQLPVMRPVSTVLGLTPIEVKGFEADDVIATLAEKALGEGMRITIFSSDKDFAQLVVDDLIEIIDPLQRRRDPTKSARRREADIRARWGVDPEQMPDFQALAGDSVDSIPGLAGVGPKTAAELIRRFGTLENMLKNADKIPHARVRAELKRKRSHADMAEKTGANWARLFLKLTTLRKNVPMSISFDDFRIRPIMKAELVEVVQSINPSANIQALFRLDLQNDRTVERVENPFEWWGEELLVPGQRLPEIPQCGFYQRRLVQGGAFVGARIWREPERDANGIDTGRDVLRCEVAGRPRDPKSEFSGLSTKPVSEAIYKFLMADAAHAKAYRPGSPQSDPTRPADIRKMPAQHSTSPQRKRR